MANPQVVIGGPSVVIPLSSPGQTPGAGQSYTGGSDSSGVKIWNGSALLWGGQNTGVTQNGITVSAFGIDGGGNFFAITVSATLSAAPATGLTVLAEDINKTSGNFDIVAAGPGVPVPTLAATPLLIGNQPVIRLSGH